MHDIDIANLLSEALRKSGCNESLLNNFDGHSTIEMECIDRPSILLSKDDDNVWIWSRLQEENNLLIEQKSAVLLPLLMKPCFFSTTDQLQLMVLDGFIILKAIVKNEYLFDSSAFARALEEFFERLTAFIEALR